MVLGGLQLGVSGDAHENKIMQRSLLITHSPWETSTCAKITPSHNIRLRHRHNSHASSRLLSQRCLLTWCKEIPIHGPWPSCTFPQQHLLDRYIVLLARSSVPIY